MSTAVFIATAFLAGAALASPFAYIGGRRSSREELAAAQRLIEVMNAAPARDELAEVALPPERTGQHRKVELYDQDADVSYPLVEALEGVGRTIGRHAAPDPDDTAEGTLAYLHSGEWMPAAPAPKRVER